MEKRLLLAIVLSFLVLFLYQAFFVKKNPPADALSDAPTEMPTTPEATPIQKPPTAIESPTGEEDIPDKPGLKLQEKPQPTQQQVEQDVVVETPLYRAVWTSRGAVLKSWIIKQHNDDNGNPVELVSPESLELRRFPFALQTEDPDFNTLCNTALYQASVLSQDLLEGEEAQLRFRFADEQQNVIVKTLTFHGGRYDIDVELEVWNMGKKVDPRLVWGPKFSAISARSQTRRIGGGSPGITVYAGAKVSRLEEKKYDVAKSAYNFVNWASYDNQYFTALFITSPQRASAVFIQEVDNQIPFYYLSVSEVEKAYIGPKQYDLLSELGYDAKKNVRFGLFGFIAEILYVAIKAVHRSFPNWGISIILLTIIIKVLFFPLTYSSTKSMSRMQELQPKIKALRAKYKKAKQDIEQRRKLNEETMRLYKEHGVNPAGGCLPMLIQLPIFFGFFRLLSIAIEFRHSPFIFWITDLSARDPYYVTPILMGITQFISQKMTPTTGDTTQQRMMLIMPVVMTFLFINFQSGLVLYWLTNNVLQIGQQYIMNRFLHKKKKETHGKRRKK